MTRWMSRMVLTLTFLALHLVQPVRVFLWFKRGIMLKSPVQGQMPASKIRYRERVRIVDVVVFLSSFYLSAPRTEVVKDLAHELAMAEGGRRVEYSMLHVEDPLSRV